MEAKMEVMEVPKETPAGKKITVDEMVQILGVSDRTLRDWRKGIEKILGKRIATYQRSGTSRKLVFGSDAVDMFNAWQTRESDESFARMFGATVQSSSFEDWSDVVDDIDSYDAEIVEEEGTLSIARVEAYQPVLRSRNGEIESLLGSIVVNSLQLQINQTKIDDEELAQAKEDAKLQFLRLHKARQEGVIEMQESLKRAEEAARNSLNNKAPKGGRRAAKSF